VCKILREPISFGSGKSRGRFFGKTRQAALHGCLPAVLPRSRGTRVSGFSPAVVGWLACSKQALCRLRPKALQQVTPETNSLREAPSRVSSQLVLLPKKSVAQAFRPGAFLPERRESSPGCPSDRSNKGENPWHA